jgi:REP element-mobilizing transposase RayT
MFDDMGGEIIEFPTDWRPDQDTVESRQAFFEDLLSSIEIPEPDVQPVHSEDSNDDPTDKIAVLDEDIEDEDGGEIVDLQFDDFDQKEGSEISAETRPTLHPSIIDRVEREIDNQDESIPNYLNETLPTPVPDYLKDTIPTPIRQFGDRELDGMQLSDEAYSHGSTYSELTYACVLAPKLPQHHLVGELASFLNRCVIQVGKAFGWQLKHLAIRPNYLHWVISIPPGSSPGYMVRIMRDHTSHRVFTQFPLFTQDNLTGDFWASGYLIVNGKYPLSHQLVEDFINKIRRRQTQPHHHSLTDI